MNLNSLGALGEIYEKLGKGDVHRRPVGSERERALIRVATLAGCRDSGPLLEEAMLDTLEGAMLAPDLEDLVIHLAAYVGMAWAIQAMLLFKRLGDEGRHLHAVAKTRCETAGLGFAERSAHGIRLYSSLDAARVPRQLEYYSRLSADYYRYGMSLFGCTFERHGLNIREREIASVSALAAIGTCQTQLAFHTKVAVEQGVELALLAEVLIQVQLYAGLPVANNAATTLIEVLFPRPVATRAVTS